MVKWESREPTVESLDSGVERQVLTDVPPSQNEKVGLERDLLMFSM